MKRMVPHRAGRCVSVNSRSHLLELLLRSVLAFPKAYNGKVAAEKRVTVNNYYIL